MYQPMAFIVLTELISNPSTVLAGNDYVPVLFIQLTWIHHSLKYTWINQTIGMSINNRYYELKRIRGYSIVSVRKHGDMSDSNKTFMLQAD